MVEGCKAPLGKHGPRLGSLADSAPPPVSPWQRCGSLEVGDPRVPERALSRARCRRSAGREKQQECDAGSKMHGHVLTEEGCPPRSTARVPGAHPSLAARAHRGPEPSASGPTCRSSAVHLSAPDERAPDERHAVGRDVPRRHQVRDEQLVCPAARLPLHPVRVKRAARADRDCPTVTFAPCAFRRCGAPVPGQAGRLFRAMRVGLPTASAHLAPARGPP